MGQLVGAGPSVAPYRKKYIESQMGAGGLYAPLAYENDDPTHPVVCVRHAADVEVTDAGLPALIAASRA